MPIPPLNTIIKEAKQQLFEEKATLEKAIRARGIHRVAMEALLITTVTTLTLVFPVIGILTNLALLGATQIISSSTKAAIDKELRAGVNPARCRAMVRSVKSVNRLIKSHRIIAIVHAIAFTLVLPWLSPIGIALGIAFEDWPGRSEGRASILKNLKIVLDPYESTSEKNRIEELFSAATRKEIQAKCELERDRRPLRVEFLEKQRKWMAIAWKRMLASEEFTPSQALNAEVFEPLCRMLVLVEIEKAGEMKMDALPPTVAAHLEKVKAAREVYEKLSAKQREALTMSLLDTKRERDSILKEVFTLIGAAASELLQNARLFESNGEPFVAGQELYHLARKEYKELLLLQRERFKLYKKRLFFDK